MAASYQSAAYEKTLSNLDYGMHFHLQKKSMKKWSHFFIRDGKKQVSQPSTEETDQIDGAPTWFLWVSQWFLNGLNRPFGKLLKLPENIIAALYPSKKNTQYDKMVAIGKNLSPSPACYVYKQNDDYNCGVRCLLFMIDLVITQVDQTWQLKKIRMGDFQKKSSWEVHLSTKSF